MRKSYVFYGCAMCRHYKRKTMDLILNERACSMFNEVYIPFYSAWWVGSSNRYSRYMPK